MRSVAYRRHLADHADLEHSEADEAARRWPVAWLLLRPAKYGPCHQLPAQVRARGRAPEGGRRSRALWVGAQAVWAWCCTCAWTGLCPAQTQALLNTQHNTEATCAPQNVQDLAIPVAINNFLPDAVIKVDGVGGREVSWMLSSCYAAAVAAAAVAAAARMAQGVAAASSSPHIPPCVTHRWRVVAATRSACECSGSRETASACSLGGRCPARRTSALKQVRGGTPRTGAESRLPDVCGNTEL